MAVLSGRHPARAEAADELPRLPVLPTLKDGLVFSACDNRLLCVVVAPEGEPGPVEQALRSLVWEEGVVGRVHCLRTTPAAWAEAVGSGEVADARGAAGLFLVAPDTFGLRGRVLAEVDPDAAPADVRAGLDDALGRFSVEWRKLDRATQITRGFEQGVLWEEFDVEHEPPSVAVSEASAGGGDAEVVEADADADAGSGSR